MGKNWAGRFFPHPDKIKHQPGADGYLGGEKLGWSVIFPLWQVKASTLPCHKYTYNLRVFGGGEKLGQPILSPPWQDKASTWCRWLSGWRKTRLVRYFPILTSESINLTLSWICKQPLLFKGGGENWAGPFFPHPDKIKHQPGADDYLGGEKLGWSVTFPPWQVKASTLRLVSYFPILTSESINLTVSWICKQPLLFRGWGKTGPAHSFLTPTR